MSSFTQNNQKTKKNQKKTPRKQIEYTAPSYVKTRAYDPEWDPNPEGESAQALSSSFAAQCSLDPKTDSVVLSQPPEAKVPWADSDVKDPFLLLPWFALEEVLVHLPDLLTLHKLCRASPAVADYLYHTPGVFPMVFERMVEHPVDEFDEESGEYLDPRNFEAGVHIDTSNFFRMLVYLWWREESAANNVPSDGNPMPDTFYHDAMWSVNHSLTGWPSLPWLGEVKLPRSTPPRILRHLMTLVVRIRADAHAYFHETIAICQSFPIEYISDWAIKKIPWQKGGRRPRGLRASSHNYGGYPLTWLEEQRLTQAFLKPYLFSVLRRVVCEKGLLKTTPPPIPDPELPYLQRLLEGHPNTLQQLKDNSLLDFWRPFAAQDSSIDELGNRRKRMEPMEQLETVLTWMEEDKAKGFKRRKQRAEFTTCCPEFGDLSPEQLKHGSSRLQFHLQPGCTFAQNCTAIPHSGVQEAGLRGDFHKFGVAFWDNERMKHLDLMTSRVDRWTDQKQLAFRWSGLLLSSKKKGIKITARKKGHRFRSRTAPIPLSD